MNVTRNMSRILNRVRRGIDNLPMVERRSRARFVEVRRRYRSSRKGSGCWGQVPAGLRHDGYFMTHLNEVEFEGKSEVAAALAALAEEMAARPDPVSDAVYTIAADDQQILRYPEVYRFGLQPRVLDLVEAYLGQEVAYHGPYVRRDFPRQAATRSRLWHLDLEDHRMFKMVIYVRGVDERNGPLELVPAPQSRQIARRFGYAGGWIRNHQLNAAIDAAPRIAATGPAGTVIFVDPSRVFHRGRPLEGPDDRYTVFFDYTTARPRRPYYCKASVSAAALETLARDLSDRGRRCVQWRQSPALN